MRGDTLLFVLRKHLLSKHLNFLFYLLRGEKNIKISEARSHGDGFVRC